MRKQLIGLLALAAIILGVIFAVSPKATTITNGASSEVYGVDILGLTKNAKDLPSHSFAAF